MYIYIIRTLTLYNYLNQTMFHKPSGVFATPPSPGRCSAAISWTLDGYPSVTWDIPYAPWCWNITRYSKIMGYP